MENNYHRAQFQSLKYINTYWWCWRELTARPKTISEFSEEKWKGGETGWEIEGKKMQRVWARNRNSPFLSKPSQFSHAWIGLAIGFKNCQLVTAFFTLTRRLRAEIPQDEPISSAFSCRRGAALARRTDTQSSRFTSDIPWQIPVEMAFGDTPSRSKIRAVIFQESTNFIVLNSDVLVTKTTHTSQEKRKQTDLTTTRIAPKPVATSSSSGACRRRSRCHK